MNFQEILGIMKASKRILEGLLHLYSGDERCVVTFKWGGLQPSTGWIQVMIRSINSTQDYQVETPDGCDERTWSSILSAHLWCHLSSGSRFVVVEELVDHKKKFISLHLQRARL
jgi:hypothetical protein